MVGNRRENESTIGVALRGQSGLSGQPVNGLQCLGIFFLEHLAMRERPPCTLVVGFDTDRIARALHGVLQLMIMTDAEFGEPRVDLGSTQHLWRAGIGSRNIDREAVDRAFGHEAAEEGIEVVVGDVEAGTPLQIPKCMLQSCECRNRRRLGAQDSGAQAYADKALRHRRVPFLRRKPAFRSY